MQDCLFVIDCMQDLKHWMTSNFLKLNESKTSHQNFI